MSTSFNGIMIPLCLLALMVDLLSLLLRLLKSIGWKVENPSEIDQTALSGARSDDVIVVDPLALPMPPLSSLLLPLNQLMHMHMPRATVEDSSPSSSPWSFLDSPCGDSDRKLCCSPGGRHVRFVKRRDQTP